VKLLFDENLAPVRVEMSSDIYPQSAHVRDFGLQSAPEWAVWEYAAKADYTIVTKDADFRQHSFLFGHPAKVIWIRLGNCSTQRIAELLRACGHKIELFQSADEQSFLSLG
jgi:predicted nuclease of predicted toxin-antitoxin system